MSLPHAHNHQRGFTIVELLLVIVVISILAVLSIATYNGVTQRAEQAAAQAAASQGRSKVQTYAVEHSDVYPDDIESAGIPTDGATTFEYSVDNGASPRTFCLTATVGTTSYYVSNAVSSPTAGLCPGHVGNAEEEPFLGYTAISAGYYHTCAIANAGTVYCWGYGATGQLGVGGTSNNSSPQETSLTGATYISAGNGASCAVASGVGYCWGVGSNGRLGVGNTTSYNVPTAVNVSGVLAGRTMTRISTYSTFGCSVADALAFCWGRNADGQLGRGGTTNSNYPVAVSTSGVLSGQTVTDIATGNYHSCAVASGSAYCWGLGESGELGRGTDVSSTTPVAVSTAGVLSGKTVTDISVGNAKSCAVASGEAFCWGYGLMGDGNLSGSLSPVAVSTSGDLSGKTVTSIAAEGNGHACVIADARLFCWGANNYGQLGVGPTPTNSTVPLAVGTSGALAGKDIVAVATGMFHTCALTSEGEAYCWGSGTYGELGNGATGNLNVPTLVIPVS